MANDSTLTPKGPTVLVGTTVVQVNAANPNEYSVSYRVRCLVTAYLAWSTNNDVTPGAPVITATAPSAGTSQPNTLGMTAGAVETFTLPPNAWFVSSVAAAFEVSPGEGV